MIPRVPRSSSPLRRPSLAPWLLACALALVLPRLARAATEPPPDLLGKTSDAFQKLGPLVDAKDWDGAIALLSSALPGTADDSYDRALLEDTLAKLYLSKDDYVDMAAALESALYAADLHSNYFLPKDHLDVVLSLSQTYSQLAQNTTKDPAQQREYYLKAASYIKRWLKSSPKPTLEVVSYYAQLLYIMAVADEKNIDFALLNQAKDETLQALRMDIKPSERLYYYLVAIYERLGDQEDCARILELLTRRYPTKSYWPFLVSKYSSLVELDEKDPDKVRADYIRGINALERAQSYGKMVESRDYFSLFRMYYNATEYGRAAEILHSNLRRGTIESTQPNWLLLANTYLIVDQNDKAIATLKEAGTRFPDSGEVDFQIGQVYLREEDAADAYEYEANAVRKGNLANPGLSYRYLANVAYELEKFPETLVAVNQAIALSEGRNVNDLVRLKKAVEQQLAVEKEDADARAKIEADQASKPADAATAPDAAPAGPAP
jgi:hypothetical protein